MTNPVRKVEAVPLAGPVWTVDLLRRLKDARRRHHDLSTVAQAAGLSRERCDVALFDLLGSTPEQAFAAILKREAAR